MTSKGSKGGKCNWTWSATSQLVDWQSGELHQIAPLATDATSTTAKKARTAWKEQPRTLTSLFTENSHRVEACWEGSLGHEACRNMADELYNAMATAPTTDKRINAAGERSRILTRALAMREILKLQDPTVQAGNAVRYEDPSDAHRAGSPSKTSIKLQRSSNEAEADATPEECFMSVCLLCAALFEQTPFWDQDLRRSLYHDFTELKRYFRKDELLVLHGRTSTVSDLFSTLKDVDKHSGLQNVIGILFEDWQVPMRVDPFIMADQLDVEVLALTCEGPIGKFACKLRTLVTLTALQQRLQQELFHSRFAGRSPPKQQMEVMTATDPLDYIDFTEAMARNMPFKHTEGDSNLYYAWMYSPEVSAKPEVWRQIFGEGHNVCPSLFDGVSMPGDLIEASPFSGHDYVLNVDKAKQHDFGAGPAQAALAFPWADDLLGAWLRKLQQDGPRKGAAAAEQQPTGQPPMYAKPAAPTQQLGAQPGGASSELQFTSRQPNSVDSSDEATPLPSSSGGSGSGCEAVGEDARAGLQRMCVDASSHGTSTSDSHTVVLHPGLHGLKLEEGAGCGAAQGGSPSLEAEPQPMECCSEPDQPPSCCEAGLKWEAPQPGSSSNTGTQPTGANNQQSIRDGNGSLIQQEQHPGAAHAASQPHVKQEPHAAPQQRDIALSGNKPSAAAPAGTGTVPSGSTSASAGSPPQTETTAAAARTAALPTMSPSKAAPIPSVEETGKLALPLGIFLVGLICSGSYTNTQIHVEDLLLMSINVNIFGAPKVWWWVPQESVQEFKDYAENMTEGGRGELYTKSISPFLNDRKEHPPASVLPLEKLRDMGVKRTIQMPGMGIWTMPGYAFHFTVSMGFNIAESCNMFLEVMGWTFDKLWRSRPPEQYPEDEDDMARFMRDTGVLGRLEVPDRAPRAAPVVHRSLAAGVLPGTALSKDGKARLTRVVCQETVKYAAIQLEDGPGPTAQLSGSLGLGLSVHQPGLDDG